MRERSHLSRLRVNRNTQIRLRRFKFIPRWMMQSEWHVWSERGQEKKASRLGRGLLFVFYDYFWFHTKCCSDSSVKTCEGSVRRELLRHAEKRLEWGKNG